MEEIIVTYKTKTYIAAEWTGDHDAVEQLHKWNNSNYWGLNFHDAHELTQARDTSLNCTIKSSLKRRMDVSKCFILIVGNNTKTVRAEVVNIVLVTMAFVVYGDIVRILVVT